MKPCWKNHKVKDKYTIYCWNCKKEITQKESEIFGSHVYCFKCYVKERLDDIENQLRPYEDDY